MKDRRRLFDFAVMVLIAVFLFRGTLFNLGFVVGPDAIGWVGYPSYLARNSWWYLGWEGVGFPGTIGQIVPMDLVIAFLFRIFDSPLGMKLLLFATYLAAGLGTYALAHRWFRSRDAALVAGILYMASRPFLDSLFEGHLSTVFGAALLPILLLSWDYMVRTRRLVHVILAAMLFSIFLGNAHLSFVYFAFFFLAPLLIWDTGKARLEARGVSWWSFLRPLLLFPIWLVPLSLVFLLPMLAGRGVAEQVSFRPAGLELETIRRLSASDLLNTVTLAGVEASSVFPKVTGDLLLPLLPALALPALFFRRQGRIFLLTFLALAFAFWAKGPNAPIGSIFSWAAEHLPYFSGARVPARALIIAGFCYALLAGVTVDAIHRWLKDSGLAWVKGKVQIRVASFGLAAVLLGTALAPQWPMLNMSVKSFYIPDDFLDLYGKLREQPGDFVVANLPFQGGPGWIDPADPEKEPGWSSTSEFGIWSSAFHGKTVLAYRQWYPYARLFLENNQRNLINSGTASRVLGTFNVKYIAALPYAPEDQVNAFSSQDGMTLAYQNGGGALYENEFWTPRIFAAPRYVLAVGGPQGLQSVASLQPSADLKLLPLISLFRHPTPTEDLIGGSDTVLFTDGEFDDLLFTALKDRGAFVADAASYVAATGIGEAAWIAEDMLTVLGGSVVSSSLGYAHAIKDGERLEVPVNVAASGTYEVWVRVLNTKGIGALDVSLDGEAQARLLPQATMPYAAFRWRKAASVELEAGSRQLSLTNVRIEEVGSENNIDQVAVVSSEMLQRERLHVAQLLEGKRLVYLVQENRLMAKLKATVDAKASDGQTLSWSDIPEPANLNVVAPADGTYFVGLRVNKSPTSKGSQIMVWANNQRIGTFDLQGRQALGGPSVLIEDNQASFWEPLNAPTQVALADDSSVKRGGSDSLRLDIKAGRSFFSLLDKEFAQPQDWSGKKFISLWFKGTGSKAQFVLQVNSNKSSGERTGLSFTDASAEWQEVILALPQADTQVDWRKVTNLRLSMETKDVAGSFYFDSLTLWDDVVADPDEKEGFSWVYVDKPILLNAGSNTLTLEPRGAVTLDLVSVSTQPGSLEDTFTYRPSDAPVVSYEKKDSTRYEANIVADRPFLLHFSESYHSGWKAYADGEELSPTPVNYFFNGFAVDKTGQYNLVIAYTPQKYVLLGAKTSGVAWLAGVLALVVVAVWTWKKPKSG